MRDFLLDTVEFLLGYAGWALGAAAVLVWGVLANEPKWILFSSLGFLLVLVTFSNWWRLLLRARKAEAALAKGRENKPKVFVEDPQVWLARYGQSGMLAEKVLFPNLAKWIVVSGRFEGTGAALAGDGVHVSLLMENGRRIPLRFVVTNGERLRSLPEGQQITAVCQIVHGFGLGAFKLDNAEPVRAEPTRAALARVS